MSVTKIEMNQTQIELAQSWLPSGSYPYAYSTKGMLWFRDHLGHKNGLKLSSDQLQKLTQLN
jgi:hypothetical protein